MKVLSVIKLLMSIANTDSSIVTKIQNRVKMQNYFNNSYVLFPDVRNNTCNDCPNLYVCNSEWKK